MTSTCSSGDSHTIKSTSNKQSTLVTPVSQKKEIDQSSNDKKSEIKMSKSGFTYQKVCIICQSEFLFKRKWKNSWKKMKTCSEKCKLEDEKRNPKKEEKKQIPLPDNPDNLPIYTYVGPTSRYKNKVGQPL